MKTQCAFLLFVPLLAVLILVPIRPLAAEGMKPLVDPSGSLTGYDVLASAGEGRIGTNCSMSRARNLAIPITATKLSGYGPSISSPRRG